MNPSIPEQIANVLGLAQKLSGRYVIQESKDGKWRQSLWVNPYMSDGGLQPPGPPLFGTPTFPTIEDAQQAIARRKADLRVVSAEDDIMLTTLHSQTENEKALYGEHPRIDELLKKFPLLENSGEPSDDAYNAPFWICNLPAVEPVDIVLDTKGDGISEDCFGTTAGALVAASYGELLFEDIGHGPTVYVKTKEEYHRIEAAIG